MKSLTKRRRARAIATRRIRQAASKAVGERIRIVGFDDDGPILDIPERFIYHPKRSEDGTLVLPKEWMD